MTEIKEVEKILGFEFKNKLLLREALTHRSYINENPSWPVPNNERLEFLGDAVLELVVTDFLFKEYSNSDEGR
ncbi:MAG: ribonuclease III domain-containing protein, partial [Candidatus Paceibacterota bacterium]